MHVTPSGELTHPIGGSIVVVDTPGDGGPSSETNNDNSGRGRHNALNRRAESVLPPVAHGSPAQKRDAMMTEILDKRLWVHFAREGVQEVAVRGCIHPRAKMMLPLGVLIDFDVPTAEQGGLKAVLDKYGNDQGEELAKQLNMDATVIGFLKPHVDQVGSCNLFS